MSIARTTISLAIIATTAAALTACSSAPQVPTTAAQQKAEPAVKIGAWTTSWTIYTFELTFNEGDSSQSGPAFFKIKGGIGIPKILREGVDGTWTMVSDSVVETRFPLPDRPDEVKQWAIEGAEENRLWLREVTEGKEQDNASVWTRLEDAS